MRNVRGSALIEVILSLVVAVTLIGAVLSVAVQHAAQVRGDDELRLAFAAALNGLEELRGIEPGRLPDFHDVGFDVPTGDGAPGALRPRPGDPDNLPGRFTVSVDRSAGGAVLYRVLAEVDWTGNGRPRHFELETLIGGRQ